MIQIWVSDSIDKPFVSRVEGQIPQLNINTKINFEEIKSFVWSDLSDEEWSAAYSLWADDNALRTFTRQNESGDFLIQFR